MIRLIHNIQIRSYDRTRFMHALSERSKNIMNGPLGDLPGMYWCPQRQRYFAAGGLAVWNEVSIDPVHGSNLASSRALAKEIFNSLPITSSVDAECAICICRSSDRTLLRVSLPCGHIFHKDCAAQWLFTRGSCPTCRQPVDVAFHTAERAARGINP
jgi:hypothetical protein